VTLMQSSFRLGKRNRQWHGSRRSTHPLTDIDRGACEAVGRPASQARSERFCWTSLPNAAGKPLDLASCCFPHASPVSYIEAGKQKTAPRDRSKPLISLRKLGAGEGIRTLDPNLGKGAGRLLRGIRHYPWALRNTVITDTCYDRARRDILRSSHAVDTMWTPFFSRGSSWTALPASF
jgi:hypothetical protein